VLCVLMLRGPQTPGELKGRTERLYPFESLSDVHETLDGLVRRELAARLERRPGQKEQRYAQLLGPGDEETVPEREPPSRGDDVASRLSRLEDEVASLRAALDSLLGTYAPDEAASASSGSAAMTAGRETSSTGSSNENVEP
jgi:uncharacterized protein